MPNEQSTQYRAILGGATSVPRNSPAWPEDVREQLVLPCSLCADVNCSLLTPRKKYFTPFSEKSRVSDQNASKPS